MKDFEIIKKIGDGSFSQVFLVKRNYDQVYYALKKIKLNLLNQREKLNALNEVRLLASIKNPHIISYKDTFIDQPLSLLCIVLEYASQGDVLSKINIHKSNDFIDREKNRNLWERDLEMSNPDSLRAVDDPLAENLP